MKYSEFRKLINDNGLEIFDRGSVLVTCPNADRVYMMIDKGDTHKFSTDFPKFSELSDHDKQILLDLAIELASTPLEEREDEKRYRLIIPFVRDSVKYLTLLKTTGTLIITHPLPYYLDYQAEFTETEIEELKREHNLDSFVLEEVLEDE